MKRLYRTCGILASASLLLLVGLATIWSLSSPARHVVAAPPQAPKPVDGWYVCQNLGLGAVPGVPEPRQRLKLCHDLGWEVYTYCTQVGLPAPRVGRRCTRISDDTYQCGARNQRVREYRTLQTPVDTPTPTSTAISTATPTLTPSLTPTRPSFVATASTTPRTPTGGEGNSAQIQALIVTETGIFLLAAVVGAWFVWRVAKRG